MTSPPDNDQRDNPLLNPPSVPHEATPFDVIKTEDFLPALKKAIEEARAAVAKIRDNPSAPTFENTIEALEFSDALLGRVSAVFGTLSSANTNDALQAMEEAFTVECVKYANDIMLDDKIFARVKAVYDQRNTLQLTGEQKMLLDNKYKSFVRSGALLNNNEKQKFRDISEKLSKLGVKFKNNTTNATQAYRKVIDNEADLKGLPVRVKNIYKAVAEELADKEKDESLRGKWVILLSPPPIDLLEYAENRGLREEVQRAMANIAYRPHAPKGTLRAAFQKAAYWVKDLFRPGYDNGPIVLEIVKLRQRLAELLGYKNFAEYVLDDRMAKTPKTVMDFLDKNESVYRPAAEKFLDEVKDFAKKTDGITDFKPWDLRYYRRKLQEKTFNFDPEELRPYFDLEKVLEGVRIHAEKLFNISLTETKGKYPVYHDDVKVYEVRDKKNGEMIGLFYTDYYARPGAKRNGAWMNNTRERGIENGENKFPFVFNTCNFDKPTKDQPTLLSLDEVRTVFHEFGHGLHGLLAQGNYHSLSGTNVKWDFVELPSQLQENWVGEKEVLDTFARHHETGAPLPAELIQKIQDMANFGAGYDGLRQTFQGILDMKWHTTDPATIKSVEEFEDAIIAKHWLFTRDGGTMSTSFGHLFAGGYAAGYYSYKWAEVLDADVFETFKEKGLYNDDIKKRLRETVYSKGGTVDPMALFIEMMGREPDPDALFRREGLLPEKKTLKPDLPKKPKPPRL